MSSFLGLVLRLSIMFVISWMILSIFRILLLTLKNKKNPSIQKTKLYDEEGNYTVKELRITNETQGEPLNLVIMIAILIFLMVVINIKIGFEIWGNEKDYPAFIMAGVPLGVLGFILIWNIIMYSLGKKKVRRWNLKSERDELTKKDMRKIDLQRKMHHFIAMGLIFAILFAGDRILKNDADIPEYEAALEGFWGAINGINYVDTILVRENNAPMAKTIVMLWMYGETLVLLTFEVTRLSKNIHFPLHKYVQGTMRYKEIDTFAALSHFALGYLVAALCLTPLMFLASMCLITFADPAASTVGINFGGKIFPKRFKWNGKSVEGLLAGTILAFITMFFFVGWVYALTGAVVFALIDLLTPKPIKVSDNMFMPIVITIAFIILSIAGIPTINYFGFA